MQSLHTGKRVYAGRGRHPPSYTAQGSRPMAYSVSRIQWLLKGDHNLCGMYNRRRGGPVVQRKGARTVGYKRVRIQYAYQGMHTARR